MDIQNLDIKKVGAVLGALLILILLVWFVVSLRSDTEQTPGETGGSFGSAPNIPLGGVGQGAGGSLPGTSSGGEGVSEDSVFSIARGPVVSAEFLETRRNRASETLVRFIQKNDGHVLERSLSEMSAPIKTVSNTTIPGIAKGFWTEGGVIIQYLSDGLLKTSSLTLPTPTTSSQIASSSLRFLPDNIAALAVSPDGENISYLLRTSSGTDGYIAESNGRSPEKRFSLPLSQIALSWPAPRTLLAYQKSAVGVPGVVFSINSQNGSVSPILYGLGLSAIASPDFAHILYHTNSGSGGATYLKEQASTESIPPIFFPFSPAHPEQCAWSPDASRIFCAAHQGSVSPNYTDLWHRGEASVADAIVSVKPETGVVAAIALPGVSGGGQLSDIVDMAVSPDGKYLIFIAKDDGSLWGVRLPSENTESSEETEPKQ